MSMMPHGIERRVERLEAKQPRRKRTWDEINIELLLVSYRIIAEYGECENLEPKSAELVEICRKHIVKTEAAIIEEAAKRANPPDATHAENYRWRVEMWRKRSGTEYVPPIVDRNGFDFDWDVPNIMQRRAALREIPEVAALLEQGRNRAQNRSLQA